MEKLSDNKMDKGTDVKMDETEEEESQGDEECLPEDLEETAEDLMTDMKLEDDYDNIKAVQPDIDWLYCIEVYPWSADDMTDSFVRIMKLAQFALVTMKKMVSNQESPEGKLQDRHRKGLLKVYLQDALSARSVMRTFTWKKMNAKRLTVEITKNGSESSQKETALLELDTYNLSKIRDREKPKGALKDRSAKLSNLPGSVTAEFLSIVFTRVFPVFDGKSGARTVENPQQKLKDMRGFDGSLDFDCTMKGSCRSFVLSHKKVHVHGQQVSIEANNEETMVVPPFTHDIGAQRKAEKEQVHSPQSMTEPVIVQAPPPPTHPSTVPAPYTPREAFVFSTMGPRAPSGLYQGPGGRVFNSNLTHRGMRARTLGRGAMAPVVRQASTHFSRPSSGMPVPMTGRQKMTEKLWRSNQVLHSAPPGGFIYPAERVAPHRPIGDSFKQEIASLQKQLEQNTRDLQAKIARLQSQQGGGNLYEEAMQSYESGDWLTEDFSYEEDDYGLETYVEEEDYGIQEEVPMLSYDQSDFESSYHHHHHPAPPQAQFMAGPVMGGAQVMRGQRIIPRKVQRGGSMLRMRAAPRLVRRGAPAQRVMGHYW